MKYSRMENIYKGRKTFIQTPAEDGFLVSVLKQIFLFLIVTAVLISLFSADIFVTWLLGG